MCPVMKVDGSPGLVPGECCGLTRNGWYCGLPCSFDGLFFWAQGFHFLSFLVLFLLPVATFGPFLSLVVEFWFLLLLESLNLISFTDRAIDH